MQACDFLCRASFLSAAQITVLLLLCVILLVLLVPKEAIPIFIRKSEKDR